MQSSFAKQATSSAENASARQSRRQSSKAELVVPGSHSASRFLQAVWHSCPGVGGVGSELSIGPGGWVVSESISQPVIERSRVNANALIFSMVFTFSFVTTHGDTQKTVPVSSPFVVL